MDQNSKISFTTGLEDPEYNWWIRQRIYSLNEPQNIYKKFLESFTDTLTEKDFMDSIAPNYSRDLFKEDYLESFKTSLSKTLNIFLKNTKETLSKSPDSKPYLDLDLVNENYLNQHSTEFLERNLLKKYDEIWEKRLNPEGSNTITRENFELFMSETQDLLLEQTKLALLEKESFFKEGPKDIDINFREGLENVSGNSIILHLTKKISQDEINLLKKTIDNKDIKALSIISTANTSENLNQYKDTFSTKKTNVYLISELQLQGMPKNQKNDIEKGIKDEKLSVVGFDRISKYIFLNKMTTQKEETRSL